MKKNRFDISKLLFLSALFLIEFATFSVNVTFISIYSQKLINLSLIILASCFFITIFRQKYNFKTLFVMLSIGLISILSALNTNDSIMIQLFLITICSLNINFDDIIKNDLKFKLLLLIFIYIMQITGNVHIEIFYRDGEIRNAFGFSQPNTFGFFIISFFFEFLYYKKEKIKYIYAFIFFFLCLYLLNIASSRSSQISICLFMFLYSIHYLKNKKKNVNKSVIQSKRNIYILKVLFPVFTLISIYLTCEYANGNHTMNFINNILSGRIYLQNIFMNIYDINIFGNNIFYFDTLDNVYIRTILNFGLVVWLLYIYIYWQMFNFANKNNDKLMIIIIIVLLIYGLMEWYIIRPAINIFLCYFSNILFLKKDRKYIERME